MVLQVEWSFHSKFMIFPYAECHFHQPIRKSAVISNTLCPYMLRGLRVFVSMCLGRSNPNTIQVSVCVWLNVWHLSRAHLQELLRTISSKSPIFLPYLENFIRCTLESKAMTDDDKIVLCVVAKCFRSALVLAFKGLNDEKLNYFHLDFP